MEVDQSKLVRSLRQAEDCMILVLFIRTSSIVRDPIYVRPLNLHQHLHYLSPPLPHIRVGSGQEMGQNQQIIEMFYNKWAE